MRLRYLQILFAPLLELQTRVLLISCDCRNFSMMLVGGPTARDAEAWPIWPEATTGAKRHTRQHPLRIYWASMPNTKWYRTFTHFLLFPLLSTTLLFSSLSTGLYCVTRRSHKQYTINSVYSLNAIAFDGCVAVTSLPPFPFFMCLVRSQFQWCMPGVKYRYVPDGPLSYITGPIPVCYLPTPALQ